MTKCTGFLLAVVGAGVACAPTVASQPRASEVEEPADPPPPAFAGQTGFVREDPEFLQVLGVDGALRLGETWRALDEGMLHCYGGTFEVAPEDGREAAIREHLTQRGFTFGESKRPGGIAATKDNATVQWHISKSGFLSWCEEFPDMVPDDIPKDFVPDDPRFRWINEIAAGLGQRNRVSIEWWPQTELIVEATGDLQDAEAAAQWLSDHGLGRPEPNAETLTTVEHDNGITSDVRLDTINRPLWTVFLRLPNGPNPWRL